MLAVVYAAAPRGHGGSRVRRRHGAAAVIAWLLALIALPFVSHGEPKRCCAASASDPSAIRLNALSLTGLWWDPARAGQAVQFVQNGETLAGVWYGYDRLGRDSWATFTRSQRGSTIFDLWRFRGPRLGTHWDPSALQSEKIGFVLLAPESSTRVRFVHQIDGVGGELVLERFAPDADDRRSGVWWDATRDGQGVQLLHEGNRLSGAWYLFDRQGRDQWVTFSGNLSGSIGTYLLYQFSGPALGGDWENDRVVGRSVGVVTLRFATDGTTEMSYHIDNASGDLRLERFELQ